MVWKIYFTIPPSTVNVSVSVQKPSRKIIKFSSAQKSILDFSGDKL